MRSRMSGPPILSYKLTECETNSETGVIRPELLEMTISSNSVTPPPLRDVQGVFHKLFSFHKPPLSRETETQKNSDCVYIL